jgi:flagellar motor switch protein FliN/FliY
MADIGLTQDQIDAMLAGATGSSAAAGGLAFSAADAQGFADFERDTMGNFPSVINAMTGFDYRLSSVEVARTSPDEIGALAGGDLVYSIPISVDGPQASFLIMDATFAKQVAAALTGAEAGSETALTEMEQSALSEVITQGAGSYLSSLSRALRISAESGGQNTLLPNAQLPGAMEPGSLVASVMMDDSSGHAAHLLHVIPPRLAKYVLDGIRAAQAPLPVAPPSAAPAASAPSAQAPQQQVPLQRSGPQDFGLPPAPSGSVMDAATAQYASASFTQLGTQAVQTDVRNLDMLLDVPLQITVELGKTQVPIRQILEYGQGSLITLDKLAGEPIDMLVNGRYFAKAEVVVIDESFGVRITSILSPAERIAQVK